jgi:hypothetical protein
MRHFHEKKLFASRRGHNGKIKEKASIGKRFVRGRRRPTFFLSRRRLDLTRRVKEH